jgi:prolyl oligopeptidase
MELLDIPDVGSRRKAGDHEYFTMRRAGEEMARLYRRPAPEEEDADEPSLDGEYEVVLDPAQFDPSYRVPVSMMGFSLDGSLMMYSIRQGGADEFEVRIRNVESGEDLPDRLPNALYGSVKFDEDGEGFTYIHRSREVRPRIRHHVLGTDPNQDELIWGEGIGPTAFISMNEVADGRYRIFGAQHGWARNDLYLQDLEGDGGIHAVVEGVSAHFQARYHEGKLYIRTDMDAPMYRLMVADPASPEPENWEILLPESEDVLQSYTFIDDKIYATYLHNVGDRIVVFEMDGTRVGEVGVPEGHSASISGNGPDSASLTLRGHLLPNTTYSVDLETGDREVEEASAIPFDSDGLVVEQVWYTSADGTRAPMYVTHREGIELDGSHPTILNGYGGFNSSIKPGFSTTAAVWLEMGGVYAVATLRGGSEFGEQWHQGGMLTNKENVFDDFIGAAEYLIEAGFTSADRLGISGGSNGGLLVASAMTKRPDLFRAVLCTYPDLDMVRFYTFTETNNMPALLEYGDASNPEHFEAIRQYSPYQAVRDGVEYPAVMLATGDLDTRVPPLQARRMTARLQAASSSGLPVILWYDDMGGHAAGRGRPMSLRVEDSARQITFLAQQLGLGGEEGA